mmetsp:Transcript_30872/g.59524  ORF Transcript_30872/g.59524 Transcript_30872/m.59524 type:complete len:596 (+) Transcript_30872:2-1789(+)
MRFVWMCGLCGRRRTHSSAKSLRGNKKTRLQACSRSLRNISMAINHPMEVARSTLVNILHFEKMNAVRSSRMSTQNTGGPTAPKWERLITALIVLSNAATDPQGIEMYNRWREEVLNLRHEFQCREASSRCKAVREYLIEVNALLNNIQQRVSVITDGRVPPPNPNEVTMAKRALEALRHANEENNPSPKRGYVPTAYASTVVFKKSSNPTPVRKLQPLGLSAPPPPMGRAPLCPPVSEGGGVIPSLEQSQRPGNGGGEARHHLLHDPYAAMRAAAQEMRAAAQQERRAAAQERTKALIPTTDRDRLLHLPSHSNAAREMISPPPRYEPLRISPPKAQQQNYPKLRSPARVGRQDPQVSGGLHSNGNSLKIGTKRYRSPSPPPSMGASGYSRAGGNSAAPPPRSTMDNKPQETKASNNGQSYPASKLQRTSINAHAATTAPVVVKREFGPTIGSAWKEFSPHGGEGRGGGASKNNKQQTTFEKEAERAAAYGLDAQPILVRAPPAPRGNPSAYRTAGGQRHSPEYKSSRPEHLYQPSHAYGSSEPPASLRGSGNSRKVGYPSIPAYAPSARRGGLASRLPDALSVPPTNAFLDRR